MTSTSPSAKRQGQALLDVFRFYLDHQDQKLGKRHRPHLNVVVNHDDLKDAKPGRTLGGVPLPGSTIRKIACDANIHRVITDGLGSILDYGRSTRTIPPAVYTSLVLRDWGCRFPGCDRPGRVVRRPPRVALGRRRTDEPRRTWCCCARSTTTSIHLKDWRLELKPDGTVEVTDPQGRLRTSDPPGRAAAA